MGAPGLVELIIIGLISLLFFGIPVIVLAVIYFNRRQSSGPVRYGRISCPECGESIAAEAIKCRFCNARFDDVDVASAEGGRSAADE